MARCINRDALMTVLATLVMWSCCGGPATTHAFRLRRSHAQTTPQLPCGFCTNTRIMRSALTAQLSSLQDTVKENMADYEISLAADIFSTSTYSGKLTLSSLTQYLNEVVSDLRCMGRALDIRCPQQSQTCSYPPGRALYRHSVMTDNAKSLRSQESVRSDYQSVRSKLAQLQLGLSGHESGTEEETCKQWADNSAMTLPFTSALLAIAQALIQDVAVHCSSPCSSR